MKLLTESYWPLADDLPLLETSCGEVLRAAAAAHGERVALVEGQAEPASRRRWTYAALLDEAECCARALLNVFKPGDHIAVWAGNNPEWVIVQYGLALAGMVLVTVNPAYRAHELGYVLRQSRARGVFHGRDYRGLDMRALVDEAVRDEGSQLAAVVCLDELHAFVASNDKGAALPTVNPRQPCMIQYTSGTTGQPKGALLNHYSVTNNSRIMALVKALDGSTINLAVAPLFHTAGCVGNVLGMAQIGATLVQPAAFDAESMLDLIEQERVTYTFGVPTMLIALLAAQARKPRNLATLKTVFSGATIVPMEVVRQVEEQFGVTLIIGYGQTETSPAITHTRPHDNAVDKSETIGQPIPQIEVKIVDPASGATLPLDTPGELCTRGFLVMMGYFDMPEATNATIDADGWLHTGDLCSMDARGFCRVTGRLKDMIIRGGENIYPREIEEVLYTHPAVAEVAVVGLPDDYWGEQVGAVVSFKSAAQASGEALRAYVAARLARHKVPSQWYALPAIPATASGKLQKFKLVEMFRGGELEAAKI
ncbi:MAG: AMP-binding protein [Gammaproteobacteria bacterium]|nr:AMP-binding protein [Gammaproteobacteria bacterium]